MKRSILFGLALAMMALGQTSVSAQPAPIKIGLVKAFFNDLDDTLIDIAMEPFGLLMKQATGLQGKLTYKDQAAEVARKLNDNELQIGVLHGHEFAWAQKQYPKLMPLMIAANKYREVRAFVIVAKDSPAKSIADLRGKKIDVPIQTKEHCLIFVKKQCGDNAGNWQPFFKEVSRSKSTFAAFDDICRGKVDAVLVDTIGLEFYKDIKGPFFAKNLRVLEQSVAFPEPVIVYKEGSLDAKTLKQFRDGLTSAHKSPEAEDVLRMWQIDRFETIPATYARSLVEVLKAYPMPAPTKVSMR